MKKIKTTKVAAQKIPKRILAVLENLEWVFNLQNYDKTIVLAEEDNDECAATIRIEEDYQRIKITLFPVFFVNTLQNQREYLLHEFCHHLVYELADHIDSLRAGELITRKQRIDSVEKSTSRIANILNALLLGRMRYARVAYKAYLDETKR